MRNISPIFKYLVSLLLVFTLQSIYAQTTSEPEFTVFPVSSEMQIGKLQKFLIDAPSGAYLTVGAERGFKAASMMPNASALWLIDISDDIIKFNQINAKLLKTPSRADYLKLRWESDFSAWDKQQAGLTQADFDWWVKHIREIDNMDYILPEYLNKFGKSPICTQKNNQNIKLTKLDKIDLGQIIDYKHGSYLFNDKLYNKIHLLALNNKIFTAKFDLGNPAQIAELIALLKEHKLLISVLDLNNLYFSEYLGEKKYLDLIHALQPFGQPTSILIAMSNYKRLACAQFQLYLGFTFGQVNKWPHDFKMQYFIDNIPSQVDDLIDGRLYTEEDTLPVFRK